MKADLNPSEKLILLQYAVWNLPCYVGLGVSRAGWPNSSAFSPTPSINGVRCGRSILLKLSRHRQASRTEALQRGGASGVIAACCSLSSCHPRYVSGAGT